MTLDDEEGCSIVNSSVGVYVMTLVVCGRRRGVLVDWPK